MKTEQKKYTKKNNYSFLAYNDHDIQNMISGVLF